MEKISGNGMYCNNDSSSDNLKNMNGGAPQGQGGFGGSSEVTNGTSANTIDEDTSVDGETYSSTGDDENALRVDGATVNTSVQNGNGVFSYGEGTTVNISDSTIRTTENNSGGIHTTGGGTMNADNLDVETSGNSAAAIRSDRGGGDVNVTGGTYATNGTGSPAIYCTADISVEDAESGTASFSSVDGSITAKKGDLFYVTNTDCEIYLQNTALTMEDADGVLLRVEGNNSSRGWGTQGSNASGDAGTVHVTLSDDSSWTLTGDSYVTSFDGDLTKVTANGYHLYVNGEQTL